MNTPFSSYSKPARFLGIALSLATSLFACCALMMPAATAAAADPHPVIAQQPLILQPSMPPDIVLMLDDSGSMNADYMPDACYLYGVTCTSDQNVISADNNAMLDASNNGVYYNPAVTYTPPPNADGSSYANQTNITNVPVDGITGAHGNIDLTNYNSKYECDDHQTCGLSSHGSPWGHIYFSTSVESQTAATYSETASSQSDCYNTYKSTPTAFGGYTFKQGTHGSGVCTFKYYLNNYFFQYSTGPAAGPYTVYYVAPAGQGCGSQSNCVTADTVANGTNGAPAGKDSDGNSITVGENIANWFAYYHTRILMAKSGLMTAFSGLDPNFRVGFGSTNGNNAALIKSFPNSYPFYTFTQPNNVLAGVAPFGKATDTTGQRFNFWNWIASAPVKNNTPLREALNAVGQYYSGDDSTTPASNAWDMMSSDPGYVSGGTNKTQIACRQAYTILTTDGFWNQSYSGAGNADGTAGNTVTGPNGQSYTYSPVAPYSDTYSDSLADVAMHYWETDLQPNMTNEVPPSTEDPAFWQHMVTFTMGLGFTPTGITGTSPNGDSPPTTQDIFDWANDGGGPNSKFAISNFGWPTPESGSINTIADLEHAGVDGHGGFFSANSPQAFVNGLDAALKRVTERVGTGASLAANSTELTTGTVIYQANYYTSIWTGDLKAFSVNSVSGAIATTPTWQASKAMPAAADRDIETWNGSSFVSFKNGASAPPSLSTAQLNALGSSPTAQEDMVSYLRGDASKEQKSGGTYRSRDTALGDIVDSQPVYSGPPDPNEFINQTFYGTTVDTSSDTVPFYTWAVGTTDSSGTFTASKASSRTPYIFVAANDGMLHAFNAQTGVETFAYLPGAAITAGLTNLANPAYGSAADPHQFYNDGQLAIADAYLPSLSQINGSSWHTILVGTTGRGLAEAVYALDVTDPTNIKPLWERSASDGLSGSNYIGQMVGRPVIAQTNYTPASHSSSASSTWSVLIGNGYNSVAGQAALLQFNLATGALSVHTTDSSTSNGLAAPVAWMDNPANGVSDMAYAGDLLGRVWSFQLNDTSGSNASPSSTGTKLFTAKDASGKVQPITSGMLAGENSQTSDIWLFFGTGEYLNSTDLINKDTQTWYGIIVQSATNHIVSNLSNGRSALVQRTITAQTSGGSGSLPARTVSTQVVNSNGTTDMSGKSGWYMDLLAPIGSGGTPVQQGERMVDPNEFQGALLIGITRIPQVTDVCNPSGSGWIMAIDPFTGAAPSSDFFDINNDGYINGGDQVNGSHAAGVGFGSLPNAPIFVGGIMETSFDNGTAASLKTAGTVGVSQRVSWRELVNP